MRVIFYVVVDEKENANIAVFTSYTAAVDFIVNERGNSDDLFIDEVPCYEFTCRE